MAPHPGQGCPVQGWWCAQLGSWHPSCILSGRLYREADTRAPPSVLLINRAVQNLSEEGAVELSHYLLGFQNVVFPQSCKDRMDVGQLVSVCLSVACKY